MYIRRKYGNKPLSQSIYLSEAEPFLEQYAKRSVQNQALIGSAGNLVRAEDFLAIVGLDEEGDLEMEREVAPLSPSPSVKDTVPKKEGLIVFFPGKNICNWLKFCLFSRMHGYSILTHIPVSYLIPNIHCSQYRFFKKCCIPVSYLIPHPYPYPCNLFFLQ